MHHKSEECAKLSSCREISRTSLAIRQGQDAWKNSHTHVERFQNDSTMLMGTADHNAHSSLIKTHECMAAFPTRRQLLGLVSMQGVNSSNV